MTRTEFIKEIRELADKLEQGNFHIMDVGVNTMFCNKNYGQIWARINENCTVSIDLYNATEEEKKEFENAQKM